MNPNQEALLEEAELTPLEPPKLSKDGFAFVKVPTAEGAEVIVLRPDGTPQGRRSQEIVEDVLESQG